MTSSSSTFPSFTSTFQRAMSPLQIASAVATGTADEGNGFANLSERKAQALGLAATFDDVLRILILDYKTVLTPALRQVLMDAERRVSIRGQLSGLEKHKAAGTSPTLLGGIKVPVFQLGKAFMAKHGDEPAELRAINEEVGRTKAKLLDLMIAAQRAELLYYDEILQPQTRIAALVQLCGDHWQNTVLPNSRVPEFEHELNPATGKLESRIKPGDWQVSPSIQASYQRQVELLPRIYYTVLALVENKQLVARQKEAAKKALKDQADQQMDTDDDNAGLKKELETLRKDLNALRLAPAVGNGNKKRASAPSRAGGGSTSKAGSSKKPAPAPKKLVEARKAMAAKTMVKQKKSDRKGKGRATN
ncbi:hypothetical protein BC629DRAFT_1590011 [Irpex lacteus]|nr:hypothetical protein BC629DRAFT_1590011 [Irpex lacteus]